MAKQKFEDLTELCRYLRSPEGCPWDKKQTLSTLKAHILEEAYEVIQAIDEADAQELREELGDLLFQVIFASQIASEEGKFSVEDVIGELHAKLVRRHPHVFGEQRAKDAEEAVQRWQGEKLKEGGRKRGILEIPRSAPALLRAQRMGEKASERGFDWQAAAGVMEKVREELRELEQAIEAGEIKSMEMEFGDLIFSMANLARHLRIDAETSAQSAADKFAARFTRVEKLAKDAGRNLVELTPAEIDALWREAKKAGE
ncbi:MAG: nucleoside triphosphate pyrophosphohydrolase [Deltaproteobacteria bacterium]